MVIEFSLANYRSFYKTQTLNFRATALVSENKEVDRNNIVVIDNTRLLKTIGIYGANASGKSNLIEGLRLMKRMVISSLVREDLSKELINPFRQTSANPGHSGFFQIVLLLKGKKYRYGFTMNKDADIEKEWLFGPAEKKETFYFKRENGEITPNAEWFKEGLNLPYEKLRSDTLFLSFCSSYDGEVSKDLRRYFANSITFDKDDSSSVRSGTLFKRSTQFNYNLTNQLLLDDGKKELILNWMKEVGLPFNDIEVKKITEGNKLAYERAIVIFSKNIYSSDGKISGIATMDLEGDESAGTQKFYSYIGRLNMNFEDGGLFVSDEIDSNFHPSLLQKLICLFNNPSINVANAQILFTSHDTNLMDPEIMRRDQFYFTEKSQIDETILFSLSDLKGIRNNADFARQYLAGIYGGLPVLGNYLEAQDD